MRRIASGFAGLLIVAAAGCGGDDGTANSPTTAATTTTAAVTTTPATATTVAPVTTAAPSTTTEPTTTTTTLPADAHPTYGGSFALLWPPPDGATAVYQVTDFGQTYELPARFDRAIEFRGTWDRLTVGTAEQNADGMTLYLDSPEPWVIHFAGWESFRADGGYTLEWYPDPVVFDFRGDFMEPLVIETVANVEFGGSVDAFGAVFTVSALGIGETVAVPAGEFVGPTFLVEVSGELMGGDFIFPVTVTAARGQYIVRMENSPGYELLELSEPWSG